MRNQALRTRLCSVRHIEIIYDDDNSHVMLLKAEYVSSSRLINENVYDAFFVILIRIAVLIAIEKKKNQTSIFSMHKVSSIRIGYILIEMV
jgi:hypothetical protein